MESDLKIRMPRDQSIIREQNKRFDRRLIMSYLNSNLKYYSKNNDKEFYNILNNLIKRKLLQIHCSNLNKENLSLLTKRQYRFLLKSENLEILESKDNLLFIST